MRMQLSEAEAGRGAKALETPPSLANLFICSSVPTWQWRVMLFPRTAMPVADTGTTLSNELWAALYFDILVTGRFTTELEKKQLSV